MADSNEKKQKKQLTPEEIQEKFADVTNSTIDDQSQFFLRSFVTEFSGNFEEVLDLAEEFKKYAPDTGVVRELEEDKAHLFLERRGETLTVVELREALKKIDLDSNNRVSFIEYCLYKYGKTLEELFEEKDHKIEHLLRKLEEAIKLYQETLAKKKAREDKMKELEQLAEQGGVKGMRAKAELEAMKNEDELERNKQEIQAGARRRAAQRAVDKGDPFAEEQKRLAEEKKKKEAEEKAKREESRKRLADRAKLWQ
ncbi:hypothetical protein PTSG_03421 [Salpingoeca rosetta]|uniref:Calcium-regulated actin-bundling protein C-terminal domain-containing protein n=1 Tax=Salpingoeca rosetta (strain ATCC 50818 / BSB-021) TaxID=946362 RepID=F2U555_SALR5|nr:uncharacterized protein PTSG_03421 [Salpingoeca rosetta]EGD82771.1 hypothetical protein PTSG_03421 [Salpingoeca rosetta]|eukprot:XP_004996007.1 hypothetical protein PTSG_03421 [Salpingoeca rosetta]